MQGGASLWSGNTRNSNGDIIVENWNRRNLNKALNGLDGDDYFVGGTRVPGVTIGYNGVVNILNAIEWGLLTDLRANEWRTVINRAEDVSNELELRACSLARGIIGGESGNQGADDAGCPDEVPIPSELLFLSLLSLLIICFFYSREDYISFAQIKQLSITIPIL